MNIHLIQVPYDSAHERSRMGRGPEHLVAGGAARALAAQGHDVRIELIQAASTFPTEVGMAFQINRLIAERVRALRDADSFPIVLAGNCNSTLGALAGLDATGIGVLWFDSHGDFNTPETSQSGFFDGMALATLTGRCWAKLAATIPGFQPIPDNQIILAGARDLDPGESELLRDSVITLLNVEDVRQRGVDGALEHILTALATRAEHIYVHLDLDVLDPAEAPANQYAAPNGFSTDEVIGIVQAIAARLPLCGATLSAYDPAYDSEGRTLRAGIRLMQVLVTAADSGPPE
jgi:arginase